MRRLSLVILMSFLVGACAEAGTDDTSDGEAEDATAQEVGGTFAGVYRTHATSLKDGDVPSLELANGAYVRARCYHASCAIRAAETDHYDTYTSSSGKTYVRFYTVKVTFDPNTGVDSHPVVADVYEIAKFSKGIKLRKSYSTRWQTLYGSSPSLQCAASGGGWQLDTCTCPGNQPNAWPATIFISGAGGCIPTPGADESACDESQGMWTDDDATAIGSYCICGSGRYLTAAGGCAAL